MRLIYWLITSVGILALLFVLFLLYIANGSTETQVTVISTFGPVALLVVTGTLLLKIQSHKKRLIKK